MTNPEERDTAYTYYQEILQRHPQDLKRLDALRERWLALNYHVQRQHADAPVLLADTSDEDLNLLGTALLNYWSRAVDTDSTTESKGFYDEIVVERTKREPARLYAEWVRDRDWALAKYRETLLSDPQNLNRLNGLWERWLVLDYCLKRQHTDVPILLADTSDKELDFLRAALFNYWDSFLGTDNDLKTKLKGLLDEVALEQDRRKASRATPVSVGIPSSRVDAAQTLDRVSATEDIEETLWRWTNEERHGLAQILGTNGSSPNNLIVALRRTAGTGVGVVLRTIRLLDELSYRDIVEDTCRRNRIRLPFKWRVAQAEVLLARKIFAGIWKDLTHEQRHELEERIEEEATAHGVGNGINLSGLGLYAAAMGAAQASGFGVYLAASTALGALSHAVGFTIPFIGYMAVSQAIQVLISPWMLIPAALIAIGPNHQRMTAAILYIAMVRSRYEVVEEVRDWRWLYWLALGVVFIFVVIWQTRLG